MRGGGLGVPDGRRYSAPQPRLLFAGVVVLGSVSSRTGSEALWTRSCLGLGQDGLDGADAAAQLEVKKLLLTIVCFGLGLVSVSTLSRPDDALASVGAVSTTALFAA